jgi:SecDF, P1 head subdomain
MLATGHRGDLLPSRWNERSTAESTPPWARRSAASPWLAKVIDVTHADRCDRDVRGGRNRRRTSADLW